MSLKFGALLWLEDSECASEADAFARLIQGIAGGAAYVNELLSGRPSSLDGPVTPPNPQNEIGVDVSGPPWCSAVRHPIAVIGGKERNTATGYGMSGVVSCTLGAPGIVWPWLFWVRPHDELPLPSIAPYSRGELDIRGHNSGAGTANLTLNVQNMSMVGDGIRVDDIGTYSIAVGTTESQLPPASPVLIPLTSGWNWLRLRFTSDSALVTTVDSACINQVVKRTH